MINHFKAICYLHEVRGVILTYYFILPDDYSGRRVSNIAFGITVVLTSNNALLQDLSRDKK